MYIWSWRMRSISRVRGLWGIDITIHEELCNCINITDKIEYGVAVGVKKRLIQGREIAKYEQVGNVSLGLAWEEFACVFLKNLGGVCFFKPILGFYTNKMGGGRKIFHGILELVGGKLRILPSSFLFDAFWSEQAARDNTPGNAPNYVPTTWECSTQGVHYP